MSKTKRVLADYDSVINPNKFWSWVDKKGEDDCWLFTGGQNTTGYGLFSLPSPDWLYEKTGRTNTQLLAHRVAYYLAYKYIHKDDDYNYICHKCDVRLCCNPSHMFIGSMYDNVHDMINKNRGFWQVKRLG